MSWGKEHVWTVERNTPLTELSLADLERLPIGAVREFVLDGVRVRATKHHSDRWLLHSGAVPMQVLADGPSRHCVERTVRT